MIANIASEYVHSLHLSIYMYNFQKAILFIVFLIPWSFYYREWKYMECKHSTTKVQAGSSSNLQEWRLENICSWKTLQTS